MSAIYSEMGHGLLILHLMVGRNEHVNQNEAKHSNIIEMRVHFQLHTDIGAGAVQTSKRVYKVVIGL